MSGRLADTSFLVAFWRDRARKSGFGERLAHDNTPSRAQVRQWASTFVGRYPDAVIASPVRIEFLAGATNRTELDRYRLFLESLDIVDGGRISIEEWKTAEDLAVRVPRDGQKRQLGDCLIEAIARRHRLETLTSDQRFSNR